jgi:hypothetical protein
MPAKGPRTLASTCRAGREARARRPTGEKAHTPGRRRIPMASRRLLAGALLAALGVIGFAWMSLLLAMSGPQTGNDRWLAPLLRWGSLVVAGLGIGIMLRGVGARTRRA